MNDPEFDLLKQEVAELKAQLRKLNQFICFNGRISGAEALVIRCSNIHIYDPDNPSRKIGLHAAKTGSSIQFDSPDGPRLKLHLDSDYQPTVEFIEPDGSTAIYLGHDKEKMPAVGVFDKGRPRAAIKASEKAGIITAVHNGGQTRALMLSQEDSGEIMLINPDMKTAVKLSTQGPQGQGVLSVNHGNGKSAAILSALPEHGCLLLNDRGGQLKYAVPDPKNI